ncbi:MAG: UTP--glucose-1-phosphate uridylyltransferase [Oscillospiraceae bacterium]|jgi:UTP--glucose-1-phosphate uridylyltransferase|nr:UTP--glucose-1-phosphate uridylyltransferase [Oscillospiraceae bacterium]
MKIKKAIIPAAGLGTRCLPATKVLSKEMIPIVDKPTIQYIVEEAVNSGIEEILIIIAKGKGIIADHFDRSPELEMKLANKTAHIKEIQSISSLANIFYLRQQRQNGLGAAVLLAEAFVGNEPFAVLYGDDVIIGDPPCTKQLCDAYEEFGVGAVAMMEYPSEEIYKYGSLKIDPRRDNLYAVTDMIEKPPRGMEFSNYAIAGRCVLPGKIFEILKNTPVGYGGELQLTDAMKQLAITEGFTGVDFIGKRYDMGNKFGILKANIEVGLNHPEIGSEVKKYLKELKID